jgi:hypothetical protein
MVWKEEKAQAESNATEKLFGITSSLFMVRESTLPECSHLDVLAGIESRQRETVRVSSSTGSIDGDWVDLRLSHQVTYHRERLLVMPIPA